MTTHITDIRSTQTTMERGGEDLVVSGRSGGDGVLGSTEEDDASDAFATPAKGATMGAK
jgi:hypothetical protein